jgi:hypothetical protein
MAKLLSGLNTIMPKSFYLTFTEHATGTTETVSVEIPDNEWQTLLDFASYADQLELTEFVQAGIDDHCEVTPDKSLRGTNPLPPVVQIRELLHVLRPLILEKERTYYSRVTGILQRYIDHRLWRGFMKGFGRSFRADNSHRFFTVRVRNLVLNSEEALNLWLNGYEYHRDPDKRSRLALSVGDELTDESRALFVDILGAKVEAVLEMRDLVRWLEQGCMVNVEPRAFRSRGAT